MLREELNPYVLFSDEILKGPTYLFRVLKNYLALKGMVYKAHPNYSRIQWGLVDSFYIGEEDRNFSYESLQTVTILPSNVETIRPKLPDVNPIEKLCDRRSNGFNINAENTPIESFDDQHNIYQLLRHFRQKDRFNGDTTQDIDEYLSKYINLCEDYSIEFSKKLENFGKVFSGNEKTFYISNQQIFYDINNACDIMRQRYKINIREEKENSTIERENQKSKYGTDISSEENNNSQNSEEKHENRKNISIDIMETNNVNKLEFAPPIYKHFGCI